MKEQKKQPELRFKGFVDDWEQRQLGNEVINIGTGKSSFKSGFLESPRTPYAVLGSTSIISYNERFDYSGNFILTARVGVNAGKLYRYSGDVKISDNTVYIQSNNLDFIYYLLNKFDIKRLSFGTGQPLIKANELKKSRIMFSVDKDEQQKIGIFFKQLDNLITLQHRKIELLNKLKKAYLQQIFPATNQIIPGLRFKGFNANWELRELGKISDKVKEKNKSGEIKETLTNSAEYGIISQRDFFDKEISNAKNLEGYYVVRNNDFVYNPRISNFAPVGPIKRNKLGRTGVMSPLYYVFRTKDIDKDFLEKYFDTVYWNHFMKLNGDSGARADRFAIKDSVLTEMPIPFPRSEEQKKIGQLFIVFNETITFQQSKIEKLKKLKRAYLQKLFL